MSKIKNIITGDLNQEKIDSVKDRLLMFIQSIGITTAEFERSIGVSGGYVSNISKSIQPDKLKIISEKYPALNIEWLLINNGEMIKDEIRVIVNNEDSTIIIKGRVITELIRASPQKQHIYNNKERSQMRTIKFRGKRTDTGEWVYGSLLVWENGDGEIMVQKSPIDCDKITVDADTVGQFTGLLDKNGKEIYEGDIVLVTEEKSDYYPAQWNSPEYKETKRWNECNTYEIGMFPEVRLDGLRLITKRDCQDIQIHGNIHDNPELLKGDN